MYKGGFTWEVRELTVSIQKKHKMYLLKKNNDITELECICVQRWANRYLAPIFGIGVYTK